MLVFCNSLNCVENTDEPQPTLQQLYFFIRLHTELQKSSIIFEFSLKNSKYLKSP